MMTEFPLMGELSLFESKRDILLLFVNISCIPFFRRSAGRVLHLSQIKLICTAAVKSFEVL